MTEAIYAYSLIKALYDRGDDYIDSFWPLALAAFPASWDQHHGPLLQDDIYGRTRAIVSTDTKTGLAIRQQRAAAWAFLPKCDRRAHDRPTSASAHPTA